MTAGKDTVFGSCLCGAVKFRVDGPLRPVIACHCTQCRKTSGHHVAATAAALKDFSLLETGGLKWFRSSSTARRAFCAECGSNLFWQRDGTDRISIMAGSLDGPTELSIELHIFCANASDYYTIPDDVLQYPADRPL